MKEGVVPADQQKEGFRIRPDNPARFFRAIQKGYEGPVGEFSLPGIAEYVNFKLHNSPYYDQFHFEASIGELKSGVDLVALFKSRGWKTEERTYESERGSYHVAISPDGSTIELHEGGKHLKIATPKYSIKELTREGSDAVLKSLTDAFKVVVDGLYESAGKTPSQEIVLSVPKFNQHLGLDFSLPSDLKEIVELEVPEVSFEDIGGQDKAKREIQKVTLALDNPDLYKKWGTSRPKGVLLYGPPGNGKTLMAKALAAESNALFIYVSLAEITSKWYSETEKNVTKVFEWAAKVGEKKSAILFFDEVDAIAMRREDAHEATQRALSAFLTAMSGFKPSGNIVVIAATNRIESLDPAFLRAERFDRKIYMGNPDKEGREKVLDIKIRQSEEFAGRSLFGEIDYEQFALKTEGYSGADIGEIIRRVLEEKANLENQGKVPGVVTLQDILVEIENYQGEATIGSQTS